MTLLEIATHVQGQLDQSTARLATLAAEHAAAIAEKNAELATLQTQYNELSSFKTAMENRVSQVLQSNDPAQYEALALDFLTPAQEKERLTTLARIEQLRAEALSLEAALTPAPNLE